MRKIPTIFERDFNGDPSRVTRAPNPAASWGPDDRWHHEAILSAPKIPGTYELCGPKVQGNPEGYDRHAMISHAEAEQLNPPRDWDGLKVWLKAFDGEGLVFHHPDGRMAKIKRRDFGF